MKKKHNYLLKVILAFFFVFLFLDISLETGYYNSKLNKKTIITQNKIKKFENDIKNNKTIDLNSYLEVEDEDYSCFTSRLVDKITNFTGNGVIKVLKTGADVLKSLFWK